MSESLVDEEDDFEEPFDDEDEEGWNEDMAGFASNLPPRTAHFELISHLNQ